MQYSSNHQKLLNIGAAQNGNCPRMVGIDGIGFTILGLLGISRWEYPISLDMDEGTLYACSPPPVPVKKKGNEVKRLWGAAIARGKLWGYRSHDSTVEIKYGFHPSAPEGMKTAVSTTITIWEKYANVNFVDVGEDWTKAQIRISFEEDMGLWSAIGTDANDGQFFGMATMNLGRLPDNVADLTSRNKGTILHEFGHALGMLHEHQSPARGGAITLNEHEVYRYYRPLLQNRDDLVKSQVIDVCNLSEVSNYSLFDEKSIMIYALPHYLLNDQKKDILPNDELSDLDKAFIMLNYPGRADNDDMTLDKALKIAGVLSSKVADDIKREVSRKNYPQARKQFIDYKDLAKGSMKANPTVVNTKSELSIQFAADPEKVNEKFANIINSRDLESVVGTLVRQVFLRRGVAATGPDAILPNVSEEYVSDVVDSLIVHPAIVRAVYTVMDGLLEPPTFSAGLTVV